MKKQSNGWQSTQGGRCVERIGVACMKANGLHQTGIEDLIMPEDRLTQQLRAPIPAAHLRRMVVAERGIGRGPGRGAKFIARQARNRRKCGVQAPLGDYYTINRFKTLRGPETRRRTRDVVTVPNGPESRRVR